MKSVVTFRKEVLFIFLQKKTRWIATQRGQRVNKDPSGDDWRYYIAS